MKKFITVLGLAIVASTGNIYAQYSGDALRFSQTNYGSSARFKGLGNAQIGLGGDMSSLGANPAGLGLFTRSEFSITPEFNNTTANASYLGQNTKVSKNQLNLNEAGAVWYHPVIKPAGSDLNKGVLSFVWGIGYNRNNDFDARYSYGATNANNSAADAYSEMANGVVYSDLAAGSPQQMAYDNYLIDETAAGNGTQYQRATSLNNTQSYNETRYGSTSELNLSGAINISNQLYLGAALGIVNVHYTSDAEYNETGQNVSTNPDNIEAGNNYYLSSRRSQTTDGAGVNGRLGLIFKPVPAVRIGATFQTPTWMHIEDNTAQVLDTRYTAAGGSVTNYYRNTPSIYPFEYNLRTPYKGSLGASVIIGNNALLTADVDYVDYASMKFSTSYNNNDRETIALNNSYIQEDYTNAINYRVGGEYKIDQLSLRAGFGLDGSPYKDDKSNAFDTKYYSGGLGYRVNQYYIDLAYQRVETTNTFSPYTLSDFSEPVANVKLAKNNVFLTFGVRF